MVQEEMQLASRDVKTVAVVWRMFAMCRGSVKYKWQTGLGVKEVLIMARFRRTN